MQSAISAVSQCLDENNELNVQLLAQKLDDKQIRHIITLCRAILVEKEDIEWKIEQFRRNGPATEHSIDILDWAIHRSNV